MDKEKEISYFKKKKVKTIRPSNKGKKSKKPFPEIQSQSSYDSLKNNGGV